jgi:hypothetical protein
MTTIINGSSPSIIFSDSTTQSTGLPAPSTSGNVLTSNGTAWTSSTAPSPASLSTASGSAPSYSARAWVNFNGTGTVAINGSGNVSSITDGGTGVYAVNFTTAMPDANYSVCGTTSDFNSPNRMIAVQQNTAPSTSSVTVATFTTGGSLSDEEINSVAIFR